MKKKNIVAIIEASSTGFGIYSDDIRGATGYGRTIEEAKESFTDSIKEIIDTAKDLGQALPKDLNNGNLDIIYKTDIASVFNYLTQIDVTNFAESIGINASLLRQYKTKKAVASPKQSKRVIEGLHELGRQLLALPA